MSKADGFRVISLWMLWELLAWYSCNREVAVQVMWEGWSCVASKLNRFREFQIPQQTMIHCYNFKNLPQIHLGFIDICHSGVYMYRILKPTDNMNWCCLFLNEAEEKEPEIQRTIMKTIPGLKCCMIGEGLSLDSYLCYITKCRISIAANCIKFKLFKLHTQIVVKWFDIFRNGG